MGHGLDRQGKGGNNGHEAEAPVALKAINVTG